MKIFLESQKETSKLSGAFTKKCPPLLLGKIGRRGGAFLSECEMYFGVAGTIWSLRNPIKKFFSSKMTLTSDYPPPPLLTYLRDMAGK